MLSQSAAPASRPSRIIEVIFLGTGTSSSVPNVPCLLRGTCAVCMSTLTPGGSKNRRRNTSVLIRVESLTDGTIKNILIDCGKTFYDSSLEFFPTFGINKIDAVLITHGHADAILGMDDLRSWTHPAGHTLPVYLSAEAMSVVARTFPYIIDTSKATGGGEVPALTFHVLPTNEDPINVCGIQVYPLPVEHGRYSDGRPYMNLGFLLDGRMAYIGDVSAIPEETYAVLERHGAPVECFIVDSLRAMPHVSHFGVNDSLAAVRRVKPSQCAYFTGMCHDIDHNALQALLVKERKDDNGRGHVETAFDGLCLRPPRWTESDSVEQSRNPSIWAKLGRR